MGIDGPAYHLINVLLIYHDPIMCLITVGNSFTIHYRGAVLHNNHQYATLTVTTEIHYGTQTNILKYGLNQLHMSPQPNL